MGKAAGYLKLTLSIMEKAKKVVMGVPSNYQENFNNKLAEI